MATAEQVKALIRSFCDDNTERFRTIALQIAAHEARQGHDSLATDIRDLIGQERQHPGPKLFPFPQDLGNLVFIEESDVKKSSLVISTELSTRIERIIHEYRSREKLKSFGLEHRRKILLVGAPGTGKTMTAKVLAHELQLPLNTIQVDRLVTKFMGETSAKLRQIFDLIRQRLGVYLFDEFDTIGGERSLDNDVGEMRRVLNSFLQFIEQDNSDSLIIAATNNPRLLDQALFRRFDDVLQYTLPGDDERRALIEKLLRQFVPKGFSWKKIVESSKSLSHAEIDRACRDAIKSAVLLDKKTVSVSLLQQTLDERHDTRIDTMQE